MIPPIVWLLIVAIGVTTIGAGSLMPEIGWFNLQGVSVNEDVFSAPLEHANVDILVSKFPGVNEQGFSIFKNRITKCSFHTPDVGGLGEGSTIICKLTDFEGHVVAEGRLDLPNGLDASVKTFIVIDQLITDLSNEIQVINDIKIIVLGGDPTCGDATQGQDPCT